MPTIRFSEIYQPKGSFRREVSQRIEARLNRMIHPYPGRKIPVNDAICLVNNLYILGIPIPSDIFQRVEPLPDNADVRTRKNYEILEKIKEAKEALVPFQTQRKRVGDFMVQFNPLRVFSREEPKWVRNTLLNCETKDVGFNFIALYHADLTYGRATFKTPTEEVEFGLYELPGPFALYHFLMFPLRADYPEEQKTNPFLQLLDLDHPEPLIALWNLLQAENEDLRIGYNAWGAYASFPMLHFQGFFVTPEWQPPIESLLNRLAEGEEPVAIAEHPLRFARWFPQSTKTLDQLIAALRVLHEKAKGDNRVTYNLYMTPKGVALFPRLRQGITFDTLQMEFKFTTGYAFFEMALEIICPDREAYEKVTESEIKKVFEIISLKEDPLGGILPEGSLAL